MRLLILFPFLGLLAACSGQSENAVAVAGDEVHVGAPPPEARGTSDTGDNVFDASTFEDAGAPRPADASTTADSGPDAGSSAIDGPPDRQTCTSKYGTGLTSGSHGRLDGILVALVPPGGHTCSSDSGHLHLQIAMNGATYDIAANVDDVDFLEVDAPLIGGAWSEGWHPGSPLDYPTSLGKHTADFASVPQAQLVAQLEADLAQANHVSVFATKYSSSGAHLVHRNGNGNDGAIVINPLSPNARYMAFHFPTQTTF